MYTEISKSTETMETSTEPASHSKARRVVIIEDDPAVAGLERTILERAGYEVEVYDSGQEGLNRVQRGGLDAVLLDNMLPDLTGADIVRQLGKKLQETPVVFITGTGDEFLATEMMKQGVADYLVKGVPNFVPLLTATVKSALARFDLMARNRALQEQVAKSEALFRTTFHSLPDPALIWEQNEDGRVVLAQINAAAKDADAAHANPVGMEAGAYFASAPEIGEVLGEVIRTGESFSGQRHLVLFGSEPRWYDLACVRFSPSGALMLVRDVTEHRLMDEALENAKIRLEQHVAERTAQLAESEEKYRSVVENASDGIAMIQDGVVRFVNRRLAEIAGKTVEELQGAKIEDLSCGEDCKGFQKQVKQCLEGAQERARGTFVFRSPAGGRVETECIISCIRFGESKAALAMFRDVTERNRIEAQLRQSQKLEAIGTLAAGIAHEINTPMQFIGDNLTFLKDATAELMSRVDTLQAAKGDQSGSDADWEYLRAEIPKAISQSLDGTKRVTDIVGALKAFAHPGSKDKSAVDLNKAVQSTATVSRNEWKYAAELEFDLDPSLPPVTCHIGDLNQVILNLIVNAAHTIADKLGPSPAQKGKIILRTRREGDQVVIQVADTGMGIPEGIRDKVFDPFFTTKGVGKGTGQGLAIAYDVVVNKHGGTISFETEEGVGTTFTVRLPIT